MPEEIDHTARWIQSEAEAQELAALVVDPERTSMLICVTTQNAASRPLLDPDALATALGDRAQVWVVTDSTHAWALTEALPPKIDVYGGAVRAWQPIAAGSTPYPTDHPQWTVFTEGDAAKAHDQILAYAEMLDNPPPAFGTKAYGLVTAVRKAGAEIELTSGHPAFASTGHLIQHGDVYHAGEILMPGQEVTVKVGPWHAQAGRVSVSLRDFAPDPWERLTEVYGVGDLIEGIVSEIKHFGAFVELMPGVEGLLHKSKIVDGFVEYVDDFVLPGDRITVRLLSIEPYERKAEVSTIDVPEGETPEPPASVFPGGPPWIPDAPGVFPGAEDNAPSADDAAEGAPTDPGNEPAQNDAGSAAAAVSTPAAPTPTIPSDDATTGPAFAAALAFMVEHHGPQVRKDLVGTPYVAHLMSVSALVLEHGGNETDGVAALLHDAIEDAGGAEMEGILTERFGPEVARIVRAVSDTDEDPKPPWRARKEAYLEHLKSVDERALRVSAADKLHNARSLVADLRRDGDLLWERFNAPKDDQLWIYGEYAGAFDARLAELGAEGGRTAELVELLRGTIAELQTLASQDAPA
ncbi:MAG: HD domain-containing protein [Solirubrobacteraceae bacterium]|nr:HD domain-containing protein [Solirubrobacteraceae bacterium]